MLAAEHLSRLGRLDVRLELVEAFDEIVFNGLARFGPLDEHAQIVGTALERLADGQLLFEPAPPLQQLLRFGLVLPEVRVGDAGLDFVELGAVSWGVKDSSADPPTVSPSPDTAEPALRSRTPRMSPLSSLAGPEGPAYISNGRHTFGITYVARTFRSASAEALCVGGSPASTTEEPRRSLPIFSS
jgi:hypothetical protein